MARGGKSRRRRSYGGASGLGRPRGGASRDGEADGDPGVPEDVSWRWHGTAVVAQAPVSDARPKLRQGKGQRGFRRSARPRGKEGARKERRGLAVSSGSLETRPRHRASPVRDSDGLAALSGEGREGKWRGE